MKKQFVNILLALLILSIPKIASSQAIGSLANIVEKRVLAFSHMLRGLRPSYHGASMNILNYAIYYTGNGLLPSNGSATSIWNISHVYVTYKFGFKKPPLKMPEDDAKLLLYIGDDMFDTFKTLEDAGVIRPNLTLAYAGIIDELLCLYYYIFRSTPAKNQILLDQGTGVYGSANLLKGLARLSFVIRNLTNSQEAGSAIMTMETSMKIDEETAMFLTGFAKSLKQALKTGPNSAKLRKIFEGSMERIAASITAIYAHQEEFCNNMDPAQFQRYLITLIENYCAIFGNLGFQKGESLALQPAEDPAALFEKLRTLSINGATPLPKLPTPDIERF